MEADLGSMVEMLTADVRRGEEPTADEKNISEHLPYSRYYARYLYVFSLVLAYEEDINLHSRKPRFWETCFLPLSFTPELALQVTWCSRQKPESCPWFFCSNHLHLLPTLLTGHGQPTCKCGSKIQKMVCLMTFSMCIVIFVTSSRKVQVTECFDIPLASPGQGWVTSKCWLFCKFIQYIVVWSWMQTLSLSQNTTLGPRFQLSHISTWIAYGHPNTRLK